MIDETTKVLMTNWALWRLSRERPGVSMTNAYSLSGGGGGDNHGTIVLINDEAFEVEQAVHAMADYLRQAIVEYWIRSDPPPRKASRCGCSLRTYWRRLERGHRAVHTYRRELHERQQKARDAYRADGVLSFAF
jgi:hypothetical protein